MYRALTGIFVLATGVMVHFERGSRTKQASGIFRIHERDHLRTVRLCHPQRHRELDLCGDEAIADCHSSPAAGNWDQAVRSNRNVAVGVGARNFPWP